MEVKTKFDFGDKVWMIGDDCDICNNEKGGHFLDPDWHDCPKCQGTGILSTPKGPYTVVSIKSESTIDGKILSESYRIEDENERVLRGDYKPSELFSSHEIKEKIGK